MKSVAHRTADMFAIIHVNIIFLELSGQSL
jgi:hypothetical protein